MGANKYKVWNESNDGAGSGLDADLLDGQQGSYYANVATNLSKTTSTTDVTINSSTGTNIAIGAASTSVAGVMTKTLYDNVIANNKSPTNTVEVLCTRAGMKKIR